MCHARICANLFFAEQTKLWSHSIMFDDGSNSSTSVYFDGFDDNTMITLPNFTSLYFFTILFF